MNIKGLVLSGGRGTRLRPITYTQAKQLIPIANKPILVYVVEDLVQAGIKDIAVIVSPETGHEVKTALGDGSSLGCRLTFITQEAPLGLAHAVKTAREFLGDDPFLMYLGDNLLTGGVTHVIEEYWKSNPESIVLLTPVNDASQFGVAELDASGNIVRLLEKPEDPPSNLAIVGVYLFSPRIHEVIDTLQPSWSGEYEITDAIQILIDRGYSVTAHRIRGWWKDTGKPKDLIEANRLVLSQLHGQIQGDIDRSEVIGEVVIKAGAKVIHSTIRGPSHIARNVRIENSYIGPYTSVGENAQVISSEVEYSILLNEAVVKNLPYCLDSSIIGRGVLVEGRSNNLRKHTLQLILGDRSQVKL